MAQVGFNFFNFLGISPFNFLNPIELIPFKNIKPADVEEILYPIFPYRP